MSAHRNFKMPKNQKSGLIRVHAGFAIPERLVTPVLDGYKDRIIFTMSDNIYNDKNVFFENAKDFDVVVINPYTRVDNEFIETIGPNLKFIYSFGAGTEHIDLKACEEKQVRIAICPYFGSGATAEFAIGLLLDTARNITKSANATLGKDWRQLRTDLYWLSGVGLKNSTVGIYGLGTIGMGVAKRLVGFEVHKILYNNRTPREEAAQLGYEYVSFETLCERSDFIICTCSVNSANYKIFNKSAFDRMRPHCVFINVARGWIVDHDALYEALSEKRILAAGLDVTTPSPLDNDSPFYNLDNCVITPHMAWSEKGTTDTRLTHALTSIVDFYEDRPICSEILFNKQSFNNDK